MRRGTMRFGSRLTVVLVIVCTLLFSGLGYLYVTRPSAGGGNLIGVIHVSGTITTSEGTGRITSAINNAMGNASIKAVVLRIDSPGGFAHLVEQVYLDVLELKQRKPVVASVVTALSGGYYIAVATDRIFTHPTSMVGNVGVIGVAPENLLPSEMNLESGPYKASGFSRLLFPFNLSHALESFAGAVEAGRGPRLRLSAKELRKGMIYMGSEAINAGLADEVGSLQSAASCAASEVGLEYYRVVDVLSGVDSEGISTSTLNGTGLPWREMTVATLNEMNPPPAIYYLYLSTEAYSMAQDTTFTSSGSSSAPVAYGKGQMVVDISHGNKVSPWVFHLLSAELAMRGVYTGYAETWDDVEDSLESASCLVVAAPTEPYTEDEFKAIEEFLGKRRILMMFFDPSSEYIDVATLLGPINSLANRYGLTFGKGYLYNMDDHYGLYRNIYVRSFADKPLTQGLESIVLFTATYLHSTDSDAAWTPYDSYASVAERRGSYAPISLITKVNKTIAAFGDLTFLTEPYAHVEDNYLLIMNIVSLITEIEVPIVEDGEEPEYNISKPDLPVGTVKLYREWVNGVEGDVWWVRTGEREASVDREDRVTVYHYDENDALIRWEREGMELVYDEPMPDFPFPLEKEKAWAYTAGYTLTADGEESRGQVDGRGRVLGFEEIDIETDGTYFCAKVHITETDELTRAEGNITSVVTQDVWISQEVGTVKVESDVKYYVGGKLALEETRSMLLVSVNMGKGEPP